MPGGCTPGVIMALSLEWYKGDVMQVMPSLSSASTSRLGVEGGEGNGEDVSRSIMGSRTRRLEPKPTYPRCITCFCMHRSVACLLHRSPRLLQLVVCKSQCQQPWHPYISLRGSNALDRALLLHQDIGEVDQAPVVNLNHTLSDGDMS